MRKVANRADQIIGFDELALPTVLPTDWGPHDAAGAVESEAILTRAT